MAETKVQADIVMDWDATSFSTDGKCNCVYYCTRCRAEGREHSIEDVPTNKRTDYGAPTHMRRCTGCGHKDGPWVYAKDHWSGGFV
jgi:hypothetical protein